MNTYYSLIYHRFKTNNRINVGLIIFNDNEFIIKFESNPTNENLKNHLFMSLQDHLYKVNPVDLNKELKVLSINNNGFIGVDKPTSIELNINTYNFEKLYQKFI